MVKISDRKYFVSYFVCALILLLVLICIAAVGTLTYKGVVTKKFISSILQIILAWPVVFLLITSIIINRFGESIDSFIKRISLLSWKDAQLEVQPEVKTVDEALSSIPDEDLARLAENSNSGAEGAFDDKKHQFSESDLEQIQNFLKIKEEEHQEQYSSLFREMLGWRFRYLDVFLVSFTKIAFLAFVRGTITSRSNYFGLYWPHGAPSPDDAALNALSGEGLIQELGGVITVTQLGSAYARHLIAHK